MAKARVGIPKRGDFEGLRKAVRKLAYRLGKTSSPDFGSVTLNDLSASRLIWTDADKLLASKDLIDLITGTTNRVIVSDDGDGSVTITGPQDMHPGASPTFVTTTLSGLTENRLVATDGSKALISITPANLIAGIANQVIVTDDGDGTVTLSTPQDIATTSEPKFLGVNITKQTPLPAAVTLGEIIHFTGDTRLYFGRSK